MNTKIFLIYTDAIMIVKKITELVVCYCCKQKKLHVKNAFVDYKKRCYSHRGIFGYISALQIESPSWSSTQITIGEILNRVKISIFDRTLNLI